jgi:signal transduction histidine kinase
VADPTDDLLDRRRLRHDVRGEATAIAWAARSLLADRPEDHQLQRLEEIARAAERLERTVDAHLPPSID